MRKLFFCIAFLATISATSSAMNETNPLLIPSTHPFGAPAFDVIKDSDFKPALEKAISIAKEELNSIIENPEAPTFENTIEALEYAGKELSDVEYIFFALNSSCTSPVIQATAEEISPLLTEFAMSVSLNTVLASRVKAVWDVRESLNLNKEQQQLLKKTYRSFQRNGANLPDDKKAEFAQVEEQLSLAKLKFGKNVLSATNAFRMNITDEAQLAGLPDYVKEMAAYEAKGHNEKGWTFTLNAPSYSPFMKFSTNRELREKMWKAYNSKCIHDEFDNTEAVKNIAQLRLKEAQILGYETYADYSLEIKMAKNKETVNTFLADLMEKSLPAARKDVAQITEYAVKNGFEGELMPWDFGFWSEKYQDEVYSLNEEILKPYFLLDNVREAAFDLANRLYGLNFKERTDIPVYHPDVKAFEVTDENNRFMALLYMDFFPRESKRGGAWMTEFRGQYIKDGIEVRPFVTLTTNFTKPTETTPSLLTFYEVTTLFHEFGHCLHGILAEGHYPSLTGTSVARDFVELPSQINENWVYEPDFLKTFARHYQTGEIIPQEYIDRIVAAKNYLAGYSQVRQLQFGITDMSWHSASEIPDGDPIEFEHKVLAPFAVLPQIDGIAFSPSFNHIFSGGYSAGYYSYKWAEVLEADAFEFFKERGIFDKEVAELFKKNILSKGSVEDEDILYRNFRGRDPKPEALLKKLGLN